MRGQNGMHEPGQDATEGRRVVWISHRSGERCAACGAELFKGDFIQITRDTGVRCMECAGYADLVFLPSGDPALTRRASVLSSRSATVVKFSKTRKHNERQGVLVEEGALEAARQACEQNAADRARMAERRRVRDEAAEQEHVARFKKKILELFPACPPADAEAIARHACAKHSGRVGRSAAAKQLEARAITLAVRVYIRHHYADYEELLLKGLEPFDARPAVADQIREVLHRWGATPDRPVNQEDHNTRYQGSGVQR